MCWREVFLSFSLSFFFFGGGGRGGGAQQNLKNRILFSHSADPNSFIILLEILYQGLIHIKRHLYGYISRTDVSLTLGFLHITSRCCCCVVALRPQ